MSLLQKYVSRAAAHIHKLRGAAAGDTPPLLRNNFPFDRAKDSGGRSPIPEVGAGSPGTLHPSLQQAGKDSTMEFKNERRGAPRAIPPEFIHGKMSLTDGERNTIDATTEPLEPNRPANGQLGGLGSPTPDVSYGGGGVSDNFMAGVTGGKGGHGKALSAGQSQQTRVIPPTRTPVQRGGSGLSAGMERLPNPANPVRPTVHPESMRDQMFSKVRGR